MYLIIHKNEEIIRGSCAVLQNGGGWDEIMETTQTVRIWNFMLFLLSDDIVVACIFFSLIMLKFKDWFFSGSLTSILSIMPVQFTTLRVNFIGISTN